MKFMRFLLSPTIVIATAIAATIAGSWGSLALAELPSPRFDRLKPLGASAGSTVAAEIQGADIEGELSLKFDHAGISARHVKDKAFEVTIAPDVPQGTYDAYLVGRFGVSNPRLFAVSRGLQDVAEDGKNNSRETAQAVEINTAVNATANGNAEDYYRITAQKGARITIDCLAQRLDSELDATLLVTTADGQNVAGNRDYYGSDPLVDFVAPADGDYIVLVHDLSYRGGFPYRLVITNHAQVESLYPAVVQAGQTTQLTALGRNLGAESRPSAWAEAGLTLEERAFTVTVPNEILDLGTYRFAEHPTHHSVVPTAATCTLAGFQAQPPGLLAPFSARPVMVTPFAVTLESEPNETQDAAQALALPAVVSGRFDRPRDADWYHLQVAENGSFAVDVYSERIAGRADPYVTILDEQGNRVSELDDFGHRMNAFDGHLRDPSGMVNLKGGTNYRLLVQDRYQRGGARYQYVLSIRSATPDLFVAAIHRSRQNPAGTTLWKGSTAVVDLVVHQWEGYNGSITVTAEGLPAGVHAEPMVLRNSNRGPFVFWSDDDAPDFVGPIRLVATGQRGEEVFRREVRPYSRVWNNSGTSQPQRQLMLAVRELAPFTLDVPPAPITVTAGEKVEFQVQLRRLWPDFKDKVTVQPMDFPGQFSLGKFDLAAGSTQAGAVLQVQPGTQPGDYTLVLEGQAQVPFAKDPQAASKPNTLVTQASRPLRVTVTAPVK